MSVNLKQEGQWLEQEKRNVALKRARELKSRIKDYLDNKQNIPNGFEKQAAFAQAKEKFCNILGPVRNNGMIGVGRWPIGSKMSKF